MNNLIHRTGDPDALFKCLEELEISLSEGDGGFTACTLSEPFFCFTRKTQEELDAVVTETIRSYIETFYQVGNVKVTTVEEPLQELSIPQTRLNPIGRLRPVIDGFLEGRGYVLA
jgi:hypothetical protein